MLGADGSGVFNGFFYLGQNGVEVRAFERSMAHKRISDVLQGVSMPTNEIACGSVRDFKPHIDASGKVWIEP